MTPLQDCAFIYTHRVTWGEMDAFNHVNNTVYFRYFEHARIGHFAAVGVMEIMEREQLGPILAETRCRFRRPLTFPDTLTIGVKIKELGEDRFTHVYLIHSEKLDAIAAEGEGKIVFFDYKAGRKHPLPQKLYDRLAAAAVSPDST